MRNYTFSCFEPGGGPGDDNTSLALPKESFDFLKGLSLSSFLTLLPGDTAY